MKSSEIKNKIFHHLEFFDETQLESFYEVFLNFIDSYSEANHSVFQNQNELNGNAIISDKSVVSSKAEHEQAIRELRAKYRK